MIITFIRNWLTARRQRKALEQLPPRPFVDTPQAWADREIIPGETRAQARARLAKHRRTDG